MPNYNASVEPSKYFSIVRPNGRVLNKSDEEMFKINENIESVLPCIYEYTSFRSNIGLSFGTLILSLDKQDISSMMKLMDLKVVDGTLPRPGSYEIVLHQQLAKNKGLKIGDYIGRLIDKTEALPASYKIVGLIDGASIVNFAPLETYMNNIYLDYEYTYGALLIPKEGRLQLMNEFLNSLPPLNLAIHNYITYSKEFNSSLLRVDTLFSLINILLIIIVSFCTAFLYYIYFSQRRSELGLLWSLGFSRQQVINRAFMEVSTTNILGYVLGILISIVCGVLLNSLYLDPLGQPLDILNNKLLLQTLCVPIFVILFSIIPVWRMLKTLDPISIIEGVM
jgi:ABC-type lipoprotein release transport system permease subunit